MADKTIQQLKLIEVSSDNLNSEIVSVSDDFFSPVTDLIKPEVSGLCRCQDNLTSDLATSQQEGPVRSKWRTVRRMGKQEAQSRIRLVGEVYSQAPRSLYTGQS